MAIFLALFLGSVDTWQAAVRTEMSDPALATQLPVERDTLQWFARAKESATFDATLHAAVMNDEKAGILEACALPDQRKDLRLWQARVQVEALISCKDRTSCGELSRAVHEMRGACLDLAVWRWEQENVVASN